MKSIITKLTIAFAFSLFSFKSYCQDIDPSKILGSWIFNKFVFLKPMPDSSKMTKESEGGVVIFMKDNKYISKQKINDGYKEETGPYSIDGNYMNQGDERVEIITLNDKELAFKIPEVMIIYFSRMKDSN